MLFLKWEPLALANKSKLLSYFLLFSHIKTHQFYKLFVLPPKSKLHPSENDIYESMNRRKIQKKTENKDFYIDEDSDSDGDKTFEEFFSSSDESTEEILRDSSDDSE